MPKLDLSSISFKQGSGYPAPYDVPCAGRRFQRLGLAGGLARLGVTRLVLPPGFYSSQRHWHTEEDEFMWVLEGEVVLITDAGEQPLGAGDCASFKAGVADGHHVHNRSQRDAVILAMSSKHEQDACDYPDIDLHAPPDSQSPPSGYQHKDGTPY